jgi:hypothetical protein
MKLSTNGGIAPTSLRKDSSNWTAEPISESLCIQASPETLKFFRHALD